MARRDRTFGVSINVVPLVGTLLVLLVVFLIAAPLKRVAVPLDLPNGDYFGEQDPVFVSLLNDGRIFVETKTGTPVIANWQTLEDAVRRVSAGDDKRRIYVRADQDVRYADVMRLMDVIRGAGFSNSAIVTEDVAN
jgi:biopolymer transport protein ExbD